jgi:Glycosyl transferase family 2
MTLSILSEETVIRSQLRPRSTPYFSICIPQHNRTSFLLTALRRLLEQTFKEFEVCISDDASTDGRSGEIIEFLSDSGLQFVFARQETNQRYDGNLRSALSLAHGEYCILMGNDDCLAHPNVLANMHHAISNNQNIGVVTPNFADYTTGHVCRRVVASRIVKGSARTAISTFRNLAFVSGVAFRRDRVEANTSAEVDGSEMYQMFLGCRILAEGYDLLELAEPVVLKDIKIRGEEVDHYTRWPQVSPCPIVERKLPMAELAKVVYAGIRCSNSAEIARCATVAVLQILMFTYPFWILEYRRVQSWRYSAGVCLGMRPRNITQGMQLMWYQQCCIAAVYAVATISGLVCPIQVFDALRVRLHAFAKSVFRPDR